MAYGAGTGVNSHHQLNYLLEKMSSPDKDFRFMALNDLMNDLQSNSITLDDGSERSVGKSFLKLLNDKNTEVQNLTVKCLPPLVGRLKGELQRKDYCLNRPFE